jgi:hypothetical protein
MTNARPPIIDLEASGLGVQGYPIEVGVILNNGSKYCSLILPTPAWNYWDDSAQQVHRISRDILETYGKPAQQVAQELNELLQGQTVFSDAWGVDKPWLTQLFFAGGIRCEFFTSALELILSEPQMAIWHSTKDDLLKEVGEKRRHRASFDAYLIQETYFRTRSALANYKLA